MATSYRALEGSKFDEKCGEIMEKLTTSKHAKIMFIEQIINPDLLAVYESCPLENEQVLFHGTPVKYSTAIEETGLDTEQSKRALYGKGNYFSPNPGYALLYAVAEYDYRVIYMCRVKMGVVGVNSAIGTDSVYRVNTNEQSIIDYKIGFYA